MKFTECPACGGVISEGMGKCRECGHDLEDDEPEDLKVTVDWVEKPRKK